MSAVRISVQRVRADAESSFDAFYAVDVEAEMRRLVDVLESDGSCFVCARVRARGHASGCVVGVALEIARCFL